MPTDCLKKLSGNFIKDCAHRPRGGLRECAYLINHQEIDKHSTQLTSKKEQITKLILKDGAKLYKAIGNETTHKAAYELVKSDYGDGFKHSYSFNIYYNGPTERENIQNFVNGGRISVIIEKLDTGLSGELTYELLGFDCGMILNSYSWSSSENSGVLTAEFASKEGQEEMTAPKIFLMQNAQNQNDLKVTQEFIQENLYG